MIYTLILETDYQSTDDKGEGWTDEEEGVDKKRFLKKKTNIFLYFIFRLILFDKM